MSQMPPDSPHVCGNTRVSEGVDAGGTASVNINQPAHELDSPPWLRVESTIMAVAESIRAAYDESMAPLGLTLSTASLLCYLADFGPVPQTRAAVHLNQGRASTGAQVDRLEAMGLAERRPDPEDRRVWLVAVTDAGRRVVDEVIETDKIVRARLRLGISRQERHELADLLMRLKSNLKQTTDDESLGEIEFDPTDLTPDNFTPDNFTPDDFSKPRDTDRLVTNSAQEPAGAPT